MPEQDSFATKIREIRQKHDLTQEQLAEFFPKGFSVNTLRNWEQGRSEPFVWMQPIIFWWLESRVFLDKLRC